MRNVSPVTFWKLEGRGTNDSWLSEEGRAEPTWRSKRMKTNWVCDLGKAMETGGSGLLRTSGGKALPTAASSASCRRIVTPPNRSPTLCSHITCHPPPGRCKEGFLYRELTQGGLDSETRSPVEGSAEILYWKLGGKLTSTHQLTRPSTSALCVSSRTLNSLVRNWRIPL